jgi:hypothetical protein
VQNNPRLRLLFIQHLVRYEPIRDAIALVAREFDILRAIRVIRAGRRAAVKGALNSAGYPCLVEVIVKALNNCDPFLAILLGANVNLLNFMARETRIDRGLCCRNAAEFQKVVHRTGPSVGQAGQVNFLAAAALGTPVTAGVMTAPVRATSATTHTLLTVTAGLHEVCGP